MNENSPPHHKVFGRQAAFEFRADRNRSGTPTITIDAALCTAPRTYDWASKSAFQLTSQELVTLALVLTGRLASIEFSNHGPARNKSFYIGSDSGAFSVRLREGVREFRGRVSYADSVYVNVLLLSQIATGTLAEPGIIAYAIERAAALFNDKPAGPAGIA